MRISDYQTTLPDIPAPVLPVGLDPANENAIEQYAYDLLLHASRVEAKLNEALEKDDKLNHFSISVNESGSVRSTLSRKSDLATIRMA